MSARFKKKRFVVFTVYTKIKFLIKMKNKQRLYVGQQKYTVMKSQKTRNIRWLYASTKIKELQRKTQIKK